MINGVSGQVMSRYPEIDYFDEPEYCLEDADCLIVPATESQPENCRNSIYASLQSVSAEQQNGSCRCKEHRCELLKP